MDLTAKSSTLASSRAFLRLPFLGRKNFSTSSLRLPAIEHFDSSLNRRRTRFTLMLVKG